ncbi:MAG: Tetratricopeptide repeat protein [Phycisphaerales bacterium]|nr:Tetratricopeptide repeat protein [Phycisphaerales bacterium]
MTARLRRIIVLLCAIAAASSSSPTATAAPRATTAIIGSTTTASPAAAATLVAGLGAADPAERERCGRELIALGQTGRVILLEAMESDDPQLRLSAADLILGLPFDQPEDPPAVAGFLKQYGRPTTAVRITYLPAIVSAAGAAAPRVLLRLVREDPSDEVRWAIVRLIRTFDRKSLPGADAFDRSSGRSPNLALAAWAWEMRDYPTAVQIYRRWLEVESRLPTVDGGAAEFAFDALTNVAFWNHEYDRVADVYRAQSARVPLGDGGRVEKLDDLFALHATFGPLPGFASDLTAAGAACARIGRPQLLYAMGRLYQRRGGQNLVADALFRAAYAASAGSSASRFAAGEFLADHGWDDLAERELVSVLALEPDPQNVQNANANLRIGLLLERRGDDAGAAQHLERAMQALTGTGRSVTRVKNGRTYENERAREQLWAEVHWHYFKAARAAGNRAEMDKHLAALLDLAPDDEQIAFDAIPTLLEIGRESEASRLFAKPYTMLRAAVDQKPDDADRMNLLAWLCARSKRHLDEARTLITAALKMHPDNSAYLDTAAEIEFHLGHAERAIELETRAIQINSDNVFFLSQLKRFQAKPNTGSTP